MKSTKLNNIIKGSALAFAMVFGLLLVTGTSVNAQDRDRRDNRQDDRYNNRNQRDDRYNGRDRNDDRYNRGDRGNDRYNRGDRDDNRGNRAAFQRGYNDGLRQGMRDGRRYRGSYGNNGGYGGNGLVISDAQRSEVSDLLYQCYEVMITRPGPVIG